MKRWKYDLIVSLGTDCACTSYLRRHDLQHASYPFDWLTNAPFEERVKTILDDFTSFLKKENFAPLPKNENTFNDSACDYYQNTSNDIHFFHDFPSGEPFESSFPKVEKKYRRRIERFYAQTKTANKVLFVWFTHGAQTPDDILKSGHKAICDKFKKTIDFLIIENDTNEAATTLKKDEPAPGIIRYRLPTIAYDKNGKFILLGRTDACDPLFKKYMLNEPLSRKLKRKTKRLILRPLIALIPIKTKRRELRKRYL